MLLGEVEQVSESVGVNRHDGAGASDLGHAGGGLDPVVDDVSDDDRCMRRAERDHPTPWGAVQPFTWVVLRRV